MSNAEARTSPAVPTKRLRGERGCTAELRRKSLQVVPTSPYTVALRQAPAHSNVVGFNLRDQPGLPLTAALALFRVRFKPGLCLTPHRSLYSFPCYQ
jgi:hypothetical protein